MTIVATDNLATISLAPSGYEPYITNAEYTLNGGTVEVDIIGSPGLTREETQTVTLDGSNSYIISWDRTHTEFEVVVRLSTPDTSKTPSVDSLRVKDQAINGDASTSTTTGSVLTSGENTTLQSDTSQTESTATTITASESVV